MYEETKGPKIGQFKSVKLLKGKRPILLLHRHSNNW